MSPLAPECARRSAVAAPRRHRALCWQGVIKALRSRNDRFRALFCPQAHREPSTLELDAGLPSASAEPSTPEVRAARRWAPAQQGRACPLNWDRRQHAAAQCAAAVGGRLNQRGSAAVRCTEARMRTRALSRRARAGARRLAADLGAPTLLGGLEVGDVQHGRRLLRRRLGGRAPAAAGRPPRCPPPRPCSRGTARQGGRRRSGRGRGGRWRWRRARAQPLACALRWRTPAAASVAAALARRPRLHRARQTWLG